MSRVSAEEIDTTGYFSWNVLLAIVLLILVLLKFKSRYIR
jgi:hypothetical protein